MITNLSLSLACDFLCIGLSIVFFWSSIIVLIGLVKREKIHPKATRKLKFAVLVCARNEESVIRRPVESILTSSYPADCREVIVLADNCTDATASVARDAGATVWEKTFPGTGKGDVLAWGLAKLAAERSVDAVAVFDADNSCAPGWLDAMNDALQDGETVATGRRNSSNPRANLISGWYTVYWDMMNELSNRVRTNIGLSAKLTGTGFAFLLSALGPAGWKTKTLVEDVEFTVQTNIRGGRVAYVPGADYFDEQPIAVKYMWRQLKRWTTGGWQVVQSYFIPWIKAMAKNPSLRLFDSFFAVFVGMSVAFILLFNFLALFVRIATGAISFSSMHYFLGVFLFVFVMGWFTAWAAVALSPRTHRPKLLSIVTFPLFTLVLSASVLYTRIRPVRRWTPIPHGAGAASSQVS